MVSVVLIILLIYQTSGQAFTDNLLDFALIIPPIAELETLLGTGEVLVYYQKQDGFNFVNRDKMMVN